MFYTVKSDYSDTNFMLAEKQLGIYGPEVFLTALVIVYLPIYTPEKSDMKKSSLTSTPKAASGKEKRGRKCETKPVW